MGNVQKIGRMQSLKRQIKRGNARIRYEKSEDGNSATVIFETKTKRGTWIETKRSKLSKNLN